MFDYRFQEDCGVFNTARTFNGKPFKLKEHIDRLFRSLLYARIDPGLSPKEIEKISLDVLELNESLRGENGDYWINQTISKGDNWPFSPESPTVAIYCRPIPFAKWAKWYKTGIHTIITSTRRIPPECVDPKAKVLSRMDLQLAQMEASRVDPEAYRLLLDLKGNTTEGAGQNFFIVKNSELLTPRSYNILEGVSRETVKELAKEQGIRSGNMISSPIDVYTADEAFYSSTSRCIIPAGDIQLCHQTVTPRIPYTIYRNWR